MHIPNPLYKSATQLIEACREHHVALVTAESCTGGLIIGALTEIAGSSDVVMQGFITYSNAAKQKALGVPAKLIEEHGAVSEPVAKAMAKGAVENAASCEGKRLLAISVTGIAGPTGGGEDKRVGTVHFGWCMEGAEPLHACRVFDGDRQAVRLATVEEAFALLTRHLSSLTPL